MITLRPKQVAAVTAIRQAYQSGKRAPLLTAPCGFGKTVIFSYVAHHALTRNNSTLIIAHRSELLDQIAETLDQFGVQYGFIAANRPGTKRSVMIASIQTLARRVEHMNYAPQMIIIDEAHHCTSNNTFGKTLKYFPASKLLGVTATACRLGGEPLGDVFDCLIKGPTTAELIDDGSLAPLRIFRPGNVLIETDGLHQRGGDFVREEAVALMDRPTITGDAVLQYQKHAAGKPFVAFCVSIEHATHVAEQFRANGIDAVCIHGGLADEVRNGIVADFRAGKILGLVSVDLISEGFNVTGITCGIMLRPTASLALFRQQVGRLLRTHPGKTEAILLDHANNVDRHGSMRVEPEWSLEGKLKRASKKQQQVHIRTCPQCWQVNEGGVSVCAGCGYQWPIESRKVEQIDGELVEWVEPKAIPPARLEEWACKTLEDWQALEKKRGYKNGWAKFRYEARRERVAMGAHETHAAPGLFDPAPVGHPEA